MDRLDNQIGDPFVKKKLAANLVACTWKNVTKRSKRMRNLEVGLLVRSLKQLSIGFTVNHVTSCFPNLPDRVKSAASSSR
jgi:hypothetical protein